MACHSRSAWTSRIFLITVLGPAFNLAAIDFWDAPGGSISSFANDTASERGLQFPDTGLEINSPLSVTWVRLRIGQFSTAYQIEAFDAASTVVATFNMNVPNSYLNLYLRGPGIMFIRFTGGGDEGSLSLDCESCGYPVQGAGLGLMVGV